MSELMAHMGKTRLRAGRDLTTVAVYLLVCAASLTAQVLTPFEVKDSAAHKLQRQWLPQLNEIGAEVQAYRFPYPFYLSRVLDIDETKQQRLEQSSIRFEKYNAQMTLEITGNYYAAYSESTMNRAVRLKKTYEDVVLPILRIAESKFPGDDSFGAFAIEVSHHVRRQAMGVVLVESPENLTFIFSRQAAHHLATALTVEQSQAALLDSSIYVDSEPVYLWQTENHPAVVQAVKTETVPRIRESSATVAPESVPQPSVSHSLIAGNPPLRLITPETLDKLNSSYHDAVARLVSSLDSQAHFVSYAPPAFVGFHQGAYLEISITSQIPSQRGSRYQLAAFAFDQHISRLIRPTLAYFQQSSDFDGISFSTTVKLPDDSSTAVEFFFPFTGIRCYANYDCTGQQLIDTGFVLVNGERVGLNLQAEAIGRE